MNKLDKKDIDFFIQDNLIMIRIFNEVFNCNDEVIQVIKELHYKHEEKDLLKLNI